MNRPNLAGITATSPKALAYQPFPYSPQERDDAAELADDDYSAEMLESVQADLHRVFAEALAGRRATLPGVIRYNGADEGEQDHWLYVVIEEPADDVLHRLLDCREATEMQIAMLLGADRIAARAKFDKWLADSYVAGEASGLLAAGWEAQ